MIALVAILALGGGWLHEVLDRQQHDKQTEQRLAVLEQIAPADTRAAKAVSSQPFDADERMAFVAHIKGRMSAIETTNVDSMRRLSATERKHRQAQEGARLEARFKSDGSDPRWAQDSETAATQAIAEPALGPFDPPANSYVRCARTMCRMEFTFDSAGAAADWAAYYPIGIGGHLPVMRSQQTRLKDGRTQLVMYGFRDAKAAVR
jgi:hypothetical protein